MCTMLQEPSVEMSNKPGSTIHINHHYAAGNLLLGNNHCFFLAMSREPESLSLFQKKKLMSIFINNHELTEDMKISLAHKLGVTQSQVTHFFQAQSKN